MLGPTLATGDRPEARLPAVHPRLLAVLRRDRDGVWPDPALAKAETGSRALGHAALGPAPLTDGRYVLVLAGTPTSFALQLDLRQLLPDAGWPWPLDGPLNATLALPGSPPWVLQPGQPAADQPRGLTQGFVFEQVLGTPSQPFVLRLQRATGPAEWPWARLAAWSATSALLLWSLAARGAVRLERRRAREMQRLTQVANLNRLGELAGGMAHELNQPLAAVLANAQAAQRLLDENPPELDTARTALSGAVRQARRAADVLSRLRRLVERPDELRPLQALSLDDTARRMIDLMAPALQRHGVRVSVSGTAPPVTADAVALEQILHNLATNALQALDAVPVDQRQLDLLIDTIDARTARITVRDHGPGIAPELLPRLFEPFFSTRAGGEHGGLGLGLSLCERLARTMGGQLSAHAALPCGAEFRLELPLATAAATAEADSP